MVQQPNQADHNSITLANILIGGVVIFAILFFLGSWHLSWYFKQFGTLIPIHELEPIFIAQMGFLQFLTIGLPLLAFLFFTKNHLKKAFIVGGVITFLLFSAIISTLVSAYDKAFDATWLSFIFDNSVPNVEIAFKVPLANSELPIGNNLENVSIKNEESKTQEKFSNDDLGSIHYVSQFKLYFESEDNYYLRSNEHFCELYGLRAKEALIKEKNAALKTEESKYAPSVAFQPTGTPFVLSPSANLPAFDRLVIDTNTPNIFKNPGTFYFNTDISKNIIKPGYTLNFPDAYIIEPIMDDSSRNEEENEYINKRECKLIILPKTQVESLKYYK